MYWVFLCSPNLNNHHYPNSIHWARGKFAAARPRMDVLWDQMDSLNGTISLRPSRGECNESVEGRAVFST